MQCFSVCICKVSCVVWEMCCTYEDTIIMQLQSPQRHHLLWHNIILWEKLSLLVCANFSTFTIRTHFNLILFLWDFLLLQDLREKTKIRQSFYPFHKKCPMQVKKQWIWHFFLSWKGSRRKGTNPLFIITIIIIIIMIINEI